MPRAWLRAACARGVIQRTSYYSKGGIYTYIAFIKNKNKGREASSYMPSTDDSGALLMNSSDGVSCGGA